MVRTHAKLYTLFVAALLLLSTPNSSLAITTSAQAPPTANAEERQRGMELYRQGKFSEAANLLRKALRQNKADDEAWYYLGVVLLHQPKEVKNASKAFESALKLRPDFAQAHAGLSYTLLLRNKPSEAIREALAGLSIDPKIAEAHYVIAMVRLREGSTEEAVHHVEEALNINPQLAPAYLLKSQALISFLSVPPASPGETRVIRFRDAADALEKYLQLNPAEKETWADQLEALRFYISTKKGSNLANSAEVTTKVRILSKPEPTYTDEARRNQVTGTVVLQAVFARMGW